MAIRAVLAHICEDRLGVARDAIHFFVQPAQRIFRLVVIEFRNCANRLPTRARVAVLARRLQVSVRASPALFLCSRSCFGNGGRTRSIRWEREKGPEQDLEQRKRKSLPTPDPAFVVGLPRQAAPY